MNHNRKIFIAFCLIALSCTKVFAGNENGGGGSLCKSDFFERISEISKITELNPSLNQEFPFLNDLLNVASPITNPNFTIIVTESPIQNCPNTADPIACSAPAQNAVTLFCGASGWDSLSKAERQKQVIHELLWWIPNYDDRNYYYSSRLNQKLVNLEIPPTVCQRSSAVRNYLVKKYRKPCDQINEYDLGELESMELTQVSELKSGDFENLIGLKELLIPSGQLNSIPKDIFDPLSSLLTLAVNVKITTVPSELLSKLKNLKEIWWRSNLDSIDENFFENNLKLKSVSLYDNNLGTIPIHLFANNHKLESVDLIKNNLKTLPIGIFDNLFNLNSLRIQSNPELKLSPEVFEPITNLKEISFDYNVWSPELFQPLMEIKSFYVDVDQMKNISNNFLKLYPNLKSASFNVLQNKEIDQINEDLIFENKQLRTFFVSGGNFETLPLNLVNRNPNLHRIAFDKCQLLYLPTGFFVPLSGDAWNNYLFLKDNRFTPKEQEKIKYGIGNTAHIYF